MSIIRRTPIILLLLLTACAPEEPEATQVPIARVTNTADSPTTTSPPETPLPTSAVLPKTPTPTPTPTIDPTLTPTPMIVTDIFSRPQTPAPYPTPLSLSAVSEEWLPHDFPNIGLSLTMPSDWEMLRYPGSYFFAPIDTSNVQLTVSLKANTPTELQPMTEALTVELQDLTPFDFYTTTITISGIESAAFWNISPASCVDLYVPAHNIVRQISFFSTFCNEARNQLNEVGQKILESFVLYPPT